MIILIAFCAFIIGVFAGGYWWHRMTMAAYRHDPTALIAVLNRHIEPENEDEDELYECVELEVEKHGNQIMMWFKECGTFVSQGETVDEALEVAHERFPKFNFHFELPDDIEYTVA